MSRNCTNILLSSACLVILAGCTTTGTSSSANAGQKRLAPTTYEVDEERVARIEHVARKRGIGVHWVNKPRRPVKSDG